MIGQILDGRYEIVRLLGRGGMGAVYEARHAGTRRRVAVKVIEGSRSDAGPDSVARFDREARAAGSIDSQHIAQVLDSGTSSATGAPYMVMEYLDGEDLQHLLDREGVLPPEVALRIAAQVCRGLAKAHEAGVVHRDVKPANLFLARRDEGEIVVKILDFGIAKLQRGAELRPGDLTETGSLLGSPRYLAPEQARASKSIDQRADLWSLGVVLYRALAGHTVHEDTTAMVELLMKICTEPPRPIQDVAPWVPPEVAAIVERALRISPLDRYPSAETMLDDIRPLLPGGFALRADMLASLDAGARALVAPRLPPTSPDHETMSVTARSAANGRAPLSSAVPAEPARGRPAVLVALAAGACLAGIAGTIVFNATTSRTPNPGSLSLAADATLATGAALLPTSEPHVAPPVVVGVSAPTVAPVVDGGSAARPVASGHDAAPLDRSRALPHAPRRPAASQGFDPASPF